MEKKIFFTSIRVKLILGASLLYTHCHFYDVDQEILGYIHISIRKWKIEIILSLFFFSSVIA